MSGYLVHRGPEPPALPHVLEVDGRYAVIDAEGREVRRCDSLELALAWTRLMVAA